MAMRKAVPDKTTGLISDNRFDEIPASHRDLIECPPVAALTTWHHRSTRNPTELQRIEANVYVERNLRPQG